MKIKKQCFLLGSGNALHLTTTVEQTMERLCINKYLTWMETIKCLIYKLHW